ncbi:MAG TPA: hypothetical protein PKC67_12690, partial [Kiritimatiellia bacterium]|nr:hypothetical protein [Kiritimatiellia bacterium]
WYYGVGHGRVARCRDYFTPSRSLPRSGRLFYADQRRFTVVGTTTDPRRFCALPPFHRGFPETEKVGE